MRSPSMLSQSLSRTHATGDRATLAVLRQPALNPWTRTDAETKRFAALWRGERMMRGVAPGSGGGQGGGGETGKLVPSTMPAPMSSFPTDVNPSTFVHPPTPRSLSQPMMAAVPTPPLVTPFARPISAMEQVRCPGKEHRNLSSSLKNSPELCARTGHALGRAHLQRPAPRVHVQHSVGSFAERSARILSSLCGQGVWCAHSYGSVGVCVCVYRSHVCCNGNRLSSESRAQLHGR